ncbi:DUF1329 domain-containing protein [Pseudomonas sp. CAN2814]|uniref:DUF1329 domain-containing protein n=1 Tax=Pseudomonas sp. CAN1 TaxID=3046726 RepID=UPI002647351F|nr:DUF1329 domain-containing protein [Pseudomonas sp. CAN1]MDN6859205.1 DUF1329 domain-containing protein [Pseudomonas sp. CAN1]
MTFKVLSSDLVPALTLAFSLVIASPFTLAKETDAAKLDGPLTVVGAERAGNADGSIPAWNGGLKPGAAAISANGDYADPFAGEKPLYVVERGNLEQYAKLLSPGQQAMFKRYPDYRMPVYPTHRTSTLPKAYQDESRANLARVTLAEGGNGLLGYNFGVPFPEPNQALEVMWNHLTRYRGGSARRSTASVTVQEKGDFTVVTNDALTAFRERVSDLDAGENLLFFNRILTTSPSRYAGEALVVQEPINQVEEPRSAWQYIPGQRRVRRAPTLAYDSSARQSFGQVVTDSVDGYNGAPDRYDWKLVGKQELLVGYNAFRLASKSLKYADLLKPGYLNPEQTRYEKHRVWVVEATLKPGARHVYAKRRFYIDEDTWQIMVSDIYDTRGELWRLYESHLANYHDVELPITVAEATYDLISGRYAVGYLSNEVRGKAEFGMPLSKSEFTSAQLKRLGK